MSKNEVEVTVSLRQEIVDRLEEVLGEESDREDFFREAIRERLALEESIEAWIRGEDPPELAAMGQKAPPPPVAQLIGFDSVVVGDGQSELTLSVGPRHANPMGTLHGGILCDLGDAAMGTAFASTLGDAESFTTLQLNVHYLKPIWEQTLRASGSVRKKGRTIGLVDSEIFDQEDRLVASMTSTCMVLQGDQAGDR